MKIHPAAEIFPAMMPEEYAELVADIRARGLIESIWVDSEGAILDGRHRARACEEIGIKYQTQTYTGDDAIAFVVSLNIHRRHLTKGQLAMAAARAREYYDAQAKDRQKARKGNQPGATPEKLPELPSDARDQVGKAFGVSGKYVDHATKVIERAVPEVIKAVDEGRMHVTTAAVLASEPEEVQREEATKPNRNRTYQSITKQAVIEQTDNIDEPQGIDVKGVGVLRAHEAINILQRIPAKDPLRRRGLQIVSDWLKNNKG